MNKKEHSRMLEVLFSYPPIASRLNERPGDKRQIVKNANEIMADLSLKTLDNFSKILDAAMDRFYENLNLEIPPDLDFEKIVTEKNVVIVPNHQSHADYVALNYMVYKRFKFPLYVAGGNNLNIIPIGSLFRRSGCFFIRRTFQNDILYKLTLEAYLYFLLREGRPIEFFFEGGRSRSGKLLSPKLGLYQMLLTAHQAISPQERKELLFWPASIVHEFVPEQRAMTRELEGAAKKKESFAQLLKIVKLFSVQLGSIHIRLGRPIVGEIAADDVKSSTWNLAYRCFREVGRNLLVTPTSLLALIMLDDPVGAIKWDEILLKARKILNFCEKFNVPVAGTLTGSALEVNLEKALDLFIANEKINILGKSSFGRVFYAIKEECRQEILYIKNTIVHHFLVPWIINLGWAKIFNGEISSGVELREFFKRERASLEYEFYLPSNPEILEVTLKFISGIIGRDLKALDETLSLSRKEYAEIARNLGVFARGVSYIYEGYYLSARAIKSLLFESTAGLEPTDSFSYEQFEKEFNYIFEEELRSGEVIKYAESCSRPLIKNSFKYFTHEKIIDNSDGSYRLLDRDGLEQIISRYAQNLKDQLSINIKI
ncbi:MAG: hypothetical protein A2504_08185 [Bdellovibrionales bacterium RIFOXYD12_FULL_39_22]|nr:MAG: hypothetical protein A2385_01410 [Bdellovibrionales bacterium RIFOXYB1_FULL_39_21]OFZ42896.1 MAG: hypothetical protein A2485_10960 [Bdellovibrionales bacterium RIFOXYC12_FULL_39_17]OFZ47444.1 MAG: hypothetical protein A2404_14330 [Bdellovibrionales bacterium RIFOXYC1_FULL_39_130]OFZ68867.1 MAG: hypothetical protein A2451_11800 [Bdellovibrionales bacterium RIFOXYC2_FULL_39_8]OFZ75532.1 MAG: hypothetical protein A2560_14480 [Bdellovibrionales bacterium RIFOXYD1_FULL_39_84]OFZ93855.1 MAG: